MNTIKMIAKAIEDLNSLGIDGAYIMFGMYPDMDEYVQIIFKGYHEGNLLQAAVMISIEDNYDGMADGLMMGVQAFKRRLAANE